MANLLQRMFEMQESRKAPFESLKGSSTHDQNGLLETLRVIQQLTQSFERLHETGGQTYSQLSNALQGWGNVATKTISQVLQLTDLQNRGEDKSVASHARAEQAKSVATLSALRSTAFYKAVAASAAGFQALGEFNFWSAAQDFTSAALWGSVAGAQVAAMASGGGGGRSRQDFHGASDRGGEAGIGAPVSELAAGAAGAKNRPSGNLTVAIMGDNEAGEWLATTLNTAVEQRGVQLTSTRSTRSAYAQG